MSIHFSCFSPILYVEHKIHFLLTPFVSSCGFFVVIRTGSIAKYDYRNPLQNGQHYGGVLPPPYDFTAMPKEFPLFLSYGGSDMLSDVNDVQLLLNDLKNHVAKKLVVLFRKEYAHVDFFMATNVKQVLYDPILSFFLVN